MILITFFKEAFNDRVTCVCRDREVRWICAMGHRLGLGLNTVGIAATMFDRVLKTVSVQAKYLQSFNFYKMNQNFSDFLIKFCNNKKLCLNY